MNLVKKMLFEEKMIIENHFHFSSRTKENRRKDLPSTHSFSTLFSNFADFSPTQNVDNTNNPRNNTFPECL